MSDDAETPSFPIKPWELIVCKIRFVEPGGYDALIPKYNLRGFLPTEAKLKVGEEVLAQFISVRNNRILLAHLPKSEQQGETQRTSDLILRNHKLNIRRATDLLVAPLDKYQQPNKVQIDHPDDFLEIVTEIEKELLTGCIKARCDPKSSRSAVLLYQGRAVGCIYGNQLKAPTDTESSLRMMLSDCATPETELIFYVIPDEIVLALSALFIGCPVERSDDLDAPSCMSNMMTWFAEKEETGCIAFSFHDGNTILTFVHNGIFVGAFQVSNQEFYDIDFVHKQLLTEPDALVEASILPADLLAPGTAPGYSLFLNMPEAETGST